MKENEIRIGNIVRQFGFTGSLVVDMSNFDQHDCFEPIRITEERLLKLGGEKLPHYTVMDSIALSIGRYRYLSIGALGTPNEMMFIIEKDRNYIKKINDLICVHNYDYDGYLTVHKLQNLYFALTGKELIKS